MTSTDYSFEGWIGLDPSSVHGNMQWRSYEPKKWTEKDVDIKITHCGICGADIHTLRSGWGPTMYPCVVGHEIIGEAVRVGKEVPEIKVGDRLGVGAQSDACLQPDCKECSRGDFHLCPSPTHHVNTYNSKYPDGTGFSYGGYAKYWRGPGQFVFKIPDALSSEDAGPMLCAGSTVYTPLTENGCGPGKTIGIVGIGGLGHFGILFAKALGADEVVAISRNSSKKADATKMGATSFIATGEDDDWASKHVSTLDIILCTVPSANIPLNGYLALLRPRGTLVLLGAPEEAIPSFAAFVLIMKHAKIAGSCIGSHQQIAEMLAFAAEKGIHPWVNRHPMKDANQAVVNFERKPPRYRFVLCN